MRLDTVRRGLYTGASMGDYKWHLFLAHAGPDQAVAERLFDLIGDRARVFLSSRSLELGDRWDQVLPEALRDSLITVVLVSPRSAQAWYQSAEIAGAIALARKDAQRVIPVYLGERPSDVPYGLETVQAATIKSDVDWATLANKLIQLSARLAERAGIRGPLAMVSVDTPPVRTVLPPRPSVLPSHDAVLGVPVFVLASDQDQAHLTELRKHLYLAQDSKILFLYTAKDGAPGDAQPLALQRLDQAALIVLLLSADLFFHHRATIDHALARQAAGARVVPVLLSDFDLATSPLKSLVALPREVGPIAKWRDKDSAWAHVARELRTLAESLAPKAQK